MNFLDRDIIGDAFVNAHYYILHGMLSANSLLLIAEFVYYSILESICAHAVETFPILINISLYLEVNLVLRIN